MKVKNDLLLEFGSSVRQRRIAMGLSQEELAERAGVHRTYIGMVERAEKNITLTNIGRIAKALQTPIAQLLKFQEKAHGQKRTER